MVTTLLKSTLREIRQSLGRYLAILAIVGLGVGFFAGLRMAQPDMMATGVAYLGDHQLFDFQLMSTLGFTGEDVAAFSQLEGIAAAEGSVYTDFLMERGENDEIVVTARSLTADINQTELMAGRMPETANECVGDSRFFTEEDLGTAVRVSPNNDEDTRELLVYDEYTLVGLVQSPYYLNYERGTSSIGTGSVSAFVYIPEEGFDFEAYHEIYLSIADGADAYSDAYEDQIDSLKPQVEDLLDQRAELRYETLYNDAMEDILEAEQELADGWEEYRSERSDAELELSDALQELLDGEADYAQGVKDYEQGKIDYAEGLQEYQDGLQEIAETPTRSCWTRRRSTPTASRNTRTADRNCWTRKRSTRTASASWRTPGTSSTTRRRSWRQAGNSSRTPRSSWRRARPSTGSSRSSIRPAPRSQPVWGIPILLHWCRISAALTRLIPGMS